MSVPREAGDGLSGADRENLDRAAALARIDLTDHNRGAEPPEFGRLRSQTPSAAQFEHPAFREWEPLLRFEHRAERCHRKTWEWAYILQAARQHGVLRAGLRAVGFGVGNEPVPAVLASHGITVVATDRMGPVDENAVRTWADRGWQLTGIEGLQRPEILPNGRAAELITTRSVDMNDVPSDLGPCDLVWSAGSFEHLGSAEHGMRFVRKTAALLAPSGIAVHTTEMDLVPHEQSIDYGELVCYQPQDLRHLAELLVQDGFEVDLNLHVAMETSDDRWVSVVLLQAAELAAGEQAHLKVALGDSVITSFGFIIRRPAAAGSRSPDRRLAAHRPRRARWRRTNDTDD